MCGVREAFRGGSKGVPILWGEKQEEEITGPENRPGRSVRVRFDGRDWCDARGDDDSDKPKKVEGTNASQSNGEKEKDNNKEDDKTAFGVGEQVSLNDVIVTMNNVTESNGSQFNEPAEGNVFILCEFTIENNSEKDLAVSSIMCFEAYVDDYSTSMSLSAIIGAEKNQLDGTVAAGKKMNGVIGYEAPADWKEIEIRFTPDFWSGKDITFVHNK